MEQNKKHRSVLRRAFTCGANELEALLSATPSDSRAIQVAWENLKVKFDDLKISDGVVYEVLLKADATEEELLAEMDSCDSYKKKHIGLRLQYETFLEALRPARQEANSERSSSSNRSPGMQRKFKLPFIEFQKYDGNVREWLSFWSQFKKIHDATDIEPSDKIQYLIQATVPGSRARQLVESFPAMGENYSKIIYSLKSRYGRDDLQVEIYIRELLKLILSSASAQQSDLSILYDKIESQMRALETLGITTDKFSAILYPLIESCLPKELLRVWQRSYSVFGSKNYSGEDNNESSLEKRLKELMSFLKNEVENEQRISLASEGFGLSSVTKFSDTEVCTKKTKNVEPKVQASVPTATGLVNVSDNCVFCSGGHNSESCFKAQKMSLEQKKRNLVEKKGCFRCVKVGHHTTKCRSRLKCILCGKGHVVLMCPDLLAHQNTREEQKPSEEKHNSQALANHTNPHVFLQTLRVQINGESGSRLVRILIDNGSQRSYILKATARELGCKIKRKEKLIHCLFGGSQNEYNHSCYDIVLQQGEFKFTFEVLDQDKICAMIPSVFQGPWVEELKLHDIHLSDMGDAVPIDILIGADAVGKLYTGRKLILKSGLEVFETYLGWVLMGKVPESNSNIASSMLNSTLSLFANDKSISNLWELDVLGILNPSEKVLREEIILSAKESFLQSVTENSEGRYEVRLPWVEQHPPLSSNYYHANRRLLSTIQKLKNESLLSAYDEIFKEWQQEGIIELVPMEELGNFGHYLPHRPVIKESSLTTKIRPVFDASAHEKEKPSLNSCLEKGANLIELIPSILLKFREFRIGVVSDIRKAFLQISLHKFDRDFLRFLWINENEEEIVYRHRRVVFGVTSSPFLLGATIEYHLSKYQHPNSAYSSETISKMTNKAFYVDNLVTSLPETSSLTQFIEEAASIMAEGKFELRGWEYTRTSDIIKTADQLSVLGLMWNPNTDTLKVNPNCLKEITDIEDIEVTKRQILSIAQRIFDPIGFVCPTTLVPKILLQRTWKKNLTWDVPVERETEEAFKSWLKELSHLLNIEIPRWVGVHPQEQLQYSLHTFCDASKDAISAVVFLRVASSSNVSIYLLAAKARVAPLKGMTIPRLELLAATIAARLFSSVRENLECQAENYFWSDSSTVISWIRRKEEWATFVWNRVAEIRKLTSIDSWRHIPGCLNPADLPSRGCSPKYLAESRWWEGPKWLYKNEELWPTEKCDFNDEDIYKERKKKVVTMLLNNCNFHDWHLDYFSKYSKTIRMIAWVFRFVRNSRNDSKIQGELSSEEFVAAEKFVLKLVQKECFSGIEDKRICTLNPFIDESDLLRLKTQVSSRNDNDFFRFPVLLPSKHIIVSSLIFEQHIICCHVGTQGLMSILREKYWILGGRRTIRTVISKCVVCKRYNAKPLTVSSPPLPIDRVRDAVVFEVSGVDFMGPLFLRNGEKVWICLFTCAIYRAVHLELTSSLSTSAFIQVLRRFVARRGRPKTIYSDNGTNFVGTNNAFSKLDWLAIAQYSTVKRIAWRFNPPTAAWWGGFWERLVGIVKQILRKVLGRASLYYEDLLTLICECEAIVNARPITYLSNDTTDLVSLTPAMFLHDLPEAGMPDCDAVERTALCHKMRHKQKLRENLQHRFRNEYLGQLRQFHKKLKHRPIVLGEVVLVGHDNQKRLDWPLGRIVEILPGKDNEIRLVRVATDKGQVLRPVQRIYPLECFDSVQLPDDPKKKEEDNSVVDQQSTAREQTENVSDSAGVPGVSDVFDIKSRVTVPFVTRSGRISRQPDRFMQT